MPESASAQWKLMSTGVLFQLSALAGGACVWLIDGAVLSIRMGAVWCVSTLPAPSMLQNSSVCTPSPVIATVVPAWVAPPSTEESVDATPDKPSWAVSATVTSAFCQSAGASEVVGGATRSILMPSPVADEWFPAWSQMLAVADRLSPSPVIPEAAGHGPSS